MKILRLLMNFLLMGYNTCSIISIILLMNFNTCSNYLLIIFNIYDPVFIRENLCHGKSKFWRTLRSVHNKQLCWCQYLRVFVVDIEHKFVYLEK